MLIEFSFTGSPHYVGGRQLGPPHPRHWLLTDEAVQVRGDSYEQTWSWAVVVAVEQRREVFLLWQRAGATIDIPRAALTVEQDAELRAFFQQRQFRSRWR